MIEEVVNSIIEAEDEAKRRVASAEKEAAEIISAAEAEAERIHKEAAASSKEYMISQLAMADKDSAERAQKLFSERKMKTDEEIASLRKNTDEAVKLILESL